MDDTGRLYTPEQRAEAEDLRKALTDISEGEYKKLRKKPQRKRVERLSQIRSKEKRRAANKRARKARSR